MHEPIRVMVLGTGQMGSGIARLVLEKQGLQMHGSTAAGSGNLGDSCRTYRTILLFHDRTQ